jgi:glycosyltransferase involved in cell wall biosynthesis
MNEVKHRKDAPVSMDIVVPLFNEQELVRVLFERLQAVFNEANKQKYHLGAVRYIFIDDGSKDETLNILKQQKYDRNKALIISFSRNFGHQAAVSAGIFSSGADITAVIDGDLQDPPELILEMLTLWRQGYDVVYGQKRKRQEGFFKNNCYKLFYRIYQWMSPVEVAVDSGDFCIMDRRVVLALNSLPEKLRFLRGLRSWVGFSQVGYQYDRGRREIGSSKYSFHRLYQLATDGITSLSIMPLKISQLFAFMFMFYSLYLFISAKLNMMHKTQADLILSLSFSNALSNSIILLCLYILGAYIGRMYFETKNRPVYIIKEILELPQS